MIRCETCLIALQIADREDNNCPDCKDYKGRRMIRCNSCMTIFDSDTLNWTTSGQLDETELTIQEDKDGWFEGCPKCKTDSHLMDLKEILL